jgi:hypothetical protein
VAVRVSRERRWVRSGVLEREKDNVSGQGRGKRTFGGRKRILRPPRTIPLAILLVEMTTRALPRPLNFHYGRCKKIHIEIH